MSLFSNFFKKNRSIGGYISSRVYASLGGSNRKKNTFVTATALPTWVHHIYNIIMIYIASCRLIFAVVFLLNFFLLSAGSSGAVPFGKSDIYGNPLVLWNLSRYDAADYFDVVRNLCASFRRWILFRIKTRGNVTCRLFVKLLTFRLYLQAIRHPVRVNPIPRQIPPGPKYLKLWVSLPSIGCPNIFLIFM